MKFPFINPVSGERLHPEGRMPRKKGLSHFSAADEMKTGLSSLSEQGAGQNVLLLPMAGDGSGRRNVPFFS
jgi:hypothetical protein